MRVILAQDYLYSFESAFVVNNNTHGHRRSSAAAARHAHTYILLLVFSPDRLYSRETRIFSNIENILTTRSRRSTEAKSRCQTRSEPPKLKDFSRIDPKPTDTVEGGNSCFELSRQDRFRRAAAVTSRIFKNISGLEVYLRLLPAQWGFWPTQ